MFNFFKPKPEYMVPPSETPNPPRSASPSGPMTEEIAPYPTPSQRDGMTPDSAEMATQRTPESQAPDTAPSSPETSRSAGQESGVREKSATDSSPAKSDQEWGPATVVEVPGSGFGTAADAWEWKDGKRVPAAKKDGGEKAA